MKIVAEQEKLFKALSTVARISNKAGKINTLFTMVKFEKLNEQEVILTTTNMDLSIRCKLDVEFVDGEGILYNANMLLSIVSKLDDKVTLNDAKITSGKNKFKIAYQEVNDFPIINFDVDSEFVEIKRDDLIKSLNSVLFASDKNSQGILTGVYFDNDNLAATDGNRLAVNKLDSKLDCVLSRDFCEELLKVFTNDLITVQREGNKIYARDNKVVLIGHLLAGKYPGYRALLPQSFKYEIELNKTLMLNAIDVLLPVIGCSCTLGIENDLMTLTGEFDNNGGNTELYLTNSNVKEKQEITFNVQFLIDILKICSDKIIIKFNNSKQAVVFEDDNGAYCLIMPILKNKA